MASGDYGKSIGAIGEGITASTIASESSLFSLVLQNSRIGGFQHDILLEVPLLLINGSGTQNLRVHYTDENGSSRVYDQDIASSSRLKIAKVSYEVKTYSENTAAAFLIDGFLTGVQQVQDRSAVSDINAGVLVFDKSAFDIIKNDPQVVNAIDRLNNLKNPDGQRRAFLRIENGLRQNANNAYFALVNRIKDIAP